MINNIQVSVDNNIYKIIDNVKPQKTFTEQKVETNQVLVDAYEEILGRPPLQEEKTRWSDYIAAGAYTNDTVYNAILIDNKALLDGDRYSADYELLLKKYKAGDYTLRQLVQATSDGVVLADEIVGATEYSNYIFDNITVANRTNSLPVGFTVEFDPVASTVPTTSIINELVKATVTHTVSGLSHVFEFTETFFPVSITGDILPSGRTKIPYLSITPADALNQIVYDYVLENNSSFAASNGSIYDDMVFTAFSTVSGLSLLQDSELDSWSRLTEEMTFDQASLNDHLSKSLVALDNTLGVVVEAARDYIRVSTTTVIDRFGRTTVPFSGVATECKIMLEKTVGGGPLSQSNGSAEDTIVINGYKAVFNRDYVDGYGLNYWSYRVLKEGLTDDALRLELASASISSTGCPATLTAALTYLELSGASELIKDRYGRSLALIGSNGAPLSSDVGCGSVYGVVLDTTAGTIEDMLRLSYIDVLGIAYPDSEGINYWVTKIDPTILQADLNAVIARGGSNSECTYIADAANAWLLNNVTDLTIDLYGRTIIDITTIPGSQCKTFIQSINEEFVDSNGSAEDIAVVQSYNDVLGRSYVDSTGMNIWATAFVANAYTQAQLDEAIALEAAVFTACPNMMDNAKAWLVANLIAIPLSTDVGAREVIPSNSIPETECSLEAASLGILFSKSNGSAEDIAVFDAYKTVLNRDYVGSSSISYWANEYTVNLWTQDELNLAIANGSIKRNMAIVAAGIPLTCVTALANARLYKTNNGGLTPQDIEHKVVSASEVNLYGTPSEKTAISNGIIFVRSNGSRLEEMVFKAYKDVLNRKYMSEASLTYWSNELDGLYNGNVNKFMEDLALNAIDIASSPEEVIAATEYRDRNISLSGTYDGRTMYDINTVVTVAGTADDEARIYLLANNGTFVNKSTSLEDEMIWNAYSTVLGRAYVDADAAYLWSQRIYDNNWNQLTMNKELAISVSNLSEPALSAFPVAVSSSQKYLLDIVGIFSSVVLNSRTVPLGYTAAFVPDAPASAEGVYLISYTLKHTASGMVDTVAKTFDETIGAYEYATALDMELGTDCERTNSAAGVVFINANTALEIELMEIYSVVLGRTHLDLAGAKYWIDDAGFQAKSLEDKKRTIASAQAQNNCAEAANATKWINNNPDVFLGVNVTSRSWSKTGYSVLYEPSAEKETYTSESYTVVATVSKGLQSKVFSFVENSVTIDTFKNILIFERNSSVPNGYSIVYSPAAVAVETTLEQKYVVTATVTDENGKTKDYTFYEIVPAATLRETADGHLLLNAVDVLDTECTTGIYGKDDIIKNNINDSRSVAVFNGFLNGLGRTYLHTAGYVYWYNDKLSLRADFDFILANAVSQEGTKYSSGCPNQYDFAYNYMSQAEYLRDSAGWYKNKTTSTTSAGSYSEVKDISQPIYVSTTHDYRDDVVLSTNITQFGTGVVAEDVKGALLEKMYLSYLGRVYDTAGYDWWLNNSAGWTYEDLAITFIGAASSEKTGRLRAVSGSKIAGYYATYADYVAAINDSASVPPVSAYIKTTSTLSGYKTKTVYNKGITTTKTTKVYFS